MKKARNGEEKEKSTCPFIFTHWIWIYGTRFLCMSGKRVVAISWALKCICSDHFLSSSISSTSCFRDECKYIALHRFLYILSMWMCVQKLDYEINARPDMLRRTKSGQVKSRQGTRPRELCVYNWHRLHILHVLWVETCKWQIWVSSDRWSRPMLKFKCFSTTLSVVYWLPNRLLVQQMFSLSTFMPISVI